MRNSGCLKRPIPVHSVKRGDVEDNIDGEEGVTIDLDEKRHIIGIEILDASKKLSIKDIVNIPIENLPIEKVDSATM